MTELSGKLLFDFDTPSVIVEAVSAAYRSLFEDEEFPDARDPEMTNHGTVNNVGPGKHTVTMGPLRTGYDIDGVHVGWANPGGKYSKASNAQNAFSQAYAIRISTALPKLQQDDVMACAKVMGDFDGLFYIKYDNGTGSSHSGSNVSDEVRSFGSSVGISDEAKISQLSDALENIAVKYAKEKGKMPTEDEVAKWFVEHGVKLDKGQMSTVMKMVSERTKFYIDESSRIEKIEQATGTTNLKEMTTTTTGLRNDPPNDEIWKNIAFMSKHLQALRQDTGLDIHVNSCFRSPAVNQAVNGSSKSFHLKGLAMDLSAGGEENNRKLYQALVKRIGPWDIDQLIMYNKTAHDQSSPIRFIHVGMNPGGEARHQKLFS